MKRLQGGMQARPRASPGQRHAASVPAVMPSGHGRAQQQGHHLIMLISQRRADRQRQRGGRRAPAPARIASVHSHIHLLARVRGRGPAKQWWAECSC